MKINLFLQAKYLHIASNSSRAGFLPYPVPFQAGRGCYVVRYRHRRSDCSPFWFTVINFTNPIVLAESNSDVCMGYPDKKNLPAYMLSNTSWASFSVSKLIDRIILPDISLISILADFIIVVGFKPRSGYRGG